MRMRMSPEKSWVGGAILRYWNSVLLAGSLLLMAIFNFVPPLQGHVSVLIFIAATAGALLLVELRVDLDREFGARKVISYDSMRVARPDIVRRMHDVIERGGPNSTEITVVGGRVITVMDILRDLSSSLHSPPRVRSKVTITVLAMRPEYLEKLRLPGDLTEPESTIRNADYATAVRSSRRELLEMSRSGPFAANAVSVRFVEYSFVPHYYCFLLDRKYLFWGFFTWDSRTSNIVGPDNPCYFVQASHPDFLQISSWFHDRASLTTSSDGRA